jgi:hypothetical protein
MRRFETIREPNPIGARYFEMNPLPTVMDSRIHRIEITVPITSSATAR